GGARPPPPRGGGPRPRRRAGGGPAVAAGGAVGAGVDAQAAAGLAVGGRPGVVAGVARLGRVGRLGVVAPAAGGVLLLADVGAEEVGGVRRAPALGRLDGDEAVLADVHLGPGVGVVAP